MAVTITGIVKYNRTLDGDYKTGKRAGQKWEFLSLDIVDSATGYIWTSQLPSEDESYQPRADNSLKGHKVRARITSQTAGDRELPNGTTVTQIRTYLTKLEDLGIPEEE